MPKLYSNILLSSLNSRRMRTEDGQEQGFKGSDDRLGTFTDSEKC
jgi:hypothetical protein